MYKRYSEYRVFLKEWSFDHINEEITNFSITDAKDLHTKTRHKKALNDLRKFVILSCVIHCYSGCIWSIGCWVEITDGE